MFFEKKIYDEMGFAVVKKQKIISVIGSLLIAVYFISMWLWGSKLLYEKGIEWAIQNTTIKELYDLGAKVQIILITKEFVDIDHKTLEKAKLTISDSRNKDNFTKDGYDLILEKKSSIFLTDLYINIISEGQGSSYYKKTYIWLFFTWINVSLGEEQGVS